MDFVKENTLTTEFQEEELEDDPQSDYEKDVHRQELERMNEEEERENALTTEFQEEELEGDPQDDYEKDVHRQELERINAEEENEK